VDVRVDPAGRQNEPFTCNRFRRHTHEQSRRHAGHDVRITGLADPGNAPVLDADIGLANAGPVDDERIGDHAVERGLVGNARGLPHAVAQHFAAAELALVAVNGGVLLDFGDERRIAQTNPVAGRRSVDRRVLMSSNRVTHS
jgi:hypothetical protein